MTDLFLTNSAGGEKARFTPVDSEHIRMYVCGPTVYNLVHIGNARPVVVFDTLYRVLQALYPKVTYARNITDIDDKIIVAARERGIDITALTQEFTDKFRTDMAALNNQAPTIEPRPPNTWRPCSTLRSVLSREGMPMSPRGMCCLMSRRWTITAL